MLIHNRKPANCMQHDEQKPFVFRRPLPWLMWFVTIITLVVIFVCTAPSLATTETPTNSADLPAFVIPAQYAQYNNYRSEWSQVTEVEFSGLHWRQSIVLYMNQGVDIYQANYKTFTSLYDEDEDEELHKATFLDYKEGTIFIKENYLTHGGQPANSGSLTIMIKREEGYDPKGGDWEYQQIAAKGQVMIKGSSQ